MPASNYMVEVKREQTNELAHELDDHDQVFHCDGPLLQGVWELLSVMTTAKGGSEEGPHEPLLFSLSTQFHPVGVSHVITVDAVSSRRTRISLCSRVLLPP